MKGKYNLKLAAIQFFVLAAYASYFNFFSLFLKSQGFSALGCGLIQATIAVLTFAYQPLVGYLVDRYLGYKRMIGLSMGVLILLGSLIPYTGESIYVMASFVIFHAMVMRQMPTLIDGWTVAIKFAHPEVKFEWTRSLGSIGAGTASVVVGIVIAKLGYDKVFWLNSFMVLIAFIMTNYLEDQKKAIGREKTTFRGSMRQLIKEPVYMTFMISAFFLSIGIKVINTFGPLMIEEVGGNSTTYGYAMFVCGFMEAFSLIWTAKMAKRMSLEGIYVIAIALQAIGSVMMFMSSSLVLFVIGRCVSGMTYTIYVAMVVAYVRKLMPPELYGVAMGVLVAGTGGIAQILSSIGGGFMLEFLSFNEVAWIMLGLVVVTIVLFIPNIVKNKEKQSHS